MIAKDTPPNREYKNSLFTALFKDKDALLELYNATTGSGYGPETDIVIHTLTDIFYRGQRNDVSFLMDHKLIVFIEHQSTLNPNMALRIFLYAAGVYKELIDQEALYGKQIDLPRPELFVLYNGNEYIDDKTIVKLSDSFMKVAGHDQIDIEVTVTVYNINEGHNAAIMEQCRTLKGYAAFVSKVREYQGPMDGLSREERKAALREAIWKAITYCVDHDILRDFIVRNAGEVVNMLTAEFDINIAERVWQEIGEERKQREILALIDTVGSLEQLKEQLTAKAGTTQDNG
jgi:hypothetical protein